MHSGNWCNGEVGPRLSSEQRVSGDKKQEEKVGGIRKFRCANSRRARLSPRHTNTSSRSRAHFRHDATRRVARTPSKRVRTHTAEAQRCAVPCTREHYNLLSGWRTLRSTIESNNGETGLRKCRGWKLKRETTGPERGRIVGISIGACEKDLPLLSLSLSLSSLSGPSYEKPNGEANGDHRDVRINIFDSRLHFFFFW